MNMNKDTLTVLKNFAGINKYMRISKCNVLMFFYHSLLLFVRAEMSDFFLKEFSIYDLI